MASFLYRLGRFAFRRRWLVATLWLAILAAALTGAATLSGSTSDAFSIPGTPSQQAIDMLGERFPQASAGGATARALAVAATFQPAIAFLGIPTPDGLEGNLAALLQKNAREKNIRLIGLTNLAEPPGREEARASGVERFISKPVTQAELDKALRNSPGG